MHNLVTVFAMAPAPMTVYQTIVPRPLPGSDQYHRDKRNTASYHVCIATLVMLINVSTLTAKTRAIPSLHRDPSLRSGLTAKVPGPCPDAASGNGSALYPPAVISKVKQRISIKLF